MEPNVFRRISRHRLVDIKNILNTSIITTQRVRDVSNKTIKSDSATDRDGSGQEQYQKREDPKDPMTEDEFKKAMTHLEALPAVKEHQLQIEVEHKGRFRTVILKEVSGKVIRRIHEAELWTLQIMKDDLRKKGQLLRKSA